MQTAKLKPNNAAKVADITYDEIRTDNDINVDTETMKGSVNYELHSSGNRRARLRRLDCSLTKTQVKAILDGQKSKLKAICENTGLELEEENDS